MATDIRCQTFKQVLEGLEKLAMTPVVSGEARPWLQNISNALVELREEFRQRVRPVHDEFFAGIGDEDPELLAHVERMQREDVGIEAGLEKLCGKAVQTINQISDQQWNESVIKESLRQLSEDAIAVVIRLRKQETALETWHGEAMQRDRGVAD